MDDSILILDASVVSIPFIAGQWSLRVGVIVYHLVGWLFQSPSLRGSGRFYRGLKRNRATIPGRFNPLHCGAVVASGRLYKRLRDLLICFNPLHCGAVVASCRQEQEEGGREESFNPLHCGAVVASAFPAEEEKMNLPWFQSPSLRGSGRFMSLIGVSIMPTPSFQSPSLRGSGRF